MAVSVSVCSSIDLRPKTLLFSSSFRDIVCICDAVGLNVFKYHWASLQRVMIRTVTSARMMMGEREKVGGKKVCYILASVGTTTDVWVTDFQQGSCESFSPGES